MTNLATTLRSSATIALGRGARLAARLRGGGSGGTALPGLVVERTDPAFLGRVLAQLPRGVVVVSGTNGKTTTTKMIVQLLQSQGLKVLTNRTGSNFIRGVLASLLTEVDWRGRVDADIAVLELDEAHAVRFIQHVRPQATLLLNVMRDQLDRFGEVDYTASLLHQVAQATTGVVVINQDDPRLVSPDFLDTLSARTASFGIGPALRSVFLSDDELHTARTSQPTAARPGEAVPGPMSPSHPTVLLEKLHGQEVTLQVRGVRRRVSMTIRGVHNQLNACAALALTLEILGPKADVSSVLDELSRVEPAFGRGEVVELDGREVELSLVKNPAGFRMGLLTAAQAEAETGPETLMVAINDEYADGRDMSWLWDVEFAGLREEGVAVVTGVRAWDMALRLRYDEVPVGAVEPDLAKALEVLRAASRRDGRRMRIFTSYTAMLALRHHLGELTEVEEVMK
ncbi:Mur ligase family protein [Actinomyces urogenitalis]|uniref:Lipid II isoglutaminyl synthase (glutamine-hydrolyzing) subunit MurT n=1 Tax=Actinomyces urogenitalis DORA_12 TaxID=1403939 RepID=W1VLE1_9ACTO|nr:Mur ligase family protein [Actinomyces urogenitalis]ETJ06818.1 MAG: putative UDP-N-acetylmuramoylalanyl-D-glutamate-2, 6-diaminopimelate ligase [Actinomyces urogenitalis DORA_12]MDK8237698.1 MurT ligase domain-containing protein [Actinomyces urogenitalis]MDU7428805.1 MurT ligase domain-containing protein [Actinomyces urogenitalis]WOO95606.1 MurT ligase domain-containing protein [Actinomyces urogenitalis]